MTESVTTEYIMFKDVNSPTVCRHETAELTIGASGDATTDPIDVRKARSILVTVDHDREGSNSTDLDATVYSSPDGVVFDKGSAITRLRYAYLENVKGGEVGSFAVPTGPAYIAVFVDNRVGTATKVKISVVVVHLG